MRLRTLMLLEMIVHRILLLLCNATNVADIVSDLILGVLKYHRHCFVYFPFPQLKASIFVG